MGKQKRKKTCNQNNNQSCEENSTREHNAQTSKDNSLDEMDELLDRMGLDIKYTGTGR